MSTSGTGTGNVGAMACRSYVLRVHRDVVESLLCDDGMDYRHALYSYAFAGYGAWVCGSASNLASLSLAFICVL